jgi:hypothetical protein
MRKPKIIPGPSRSTSLLNGHSGSTSATMQSRTAVASVQRTALATPSRCTRTSGTRHAYHRPPASMPLFNSDMRHTSTSHTADIQLAARRARSRVTAPARSSHSRPSQMDASIHRFTAAVRSCFPSKPAMITGSNTRKTSTHAFSRRT